MSLRRPAGHQRRASDWRRSGDESCWESSAPEGNSARCVSQPPRRPQSAIEGGRLDGWLEHLRAMQSDPLGAPGHGERVPGARPASVTTFDKGPTGPAWRHQGTPASRRPSSSCGSLSLCEGSLGSQEYLQTGICSPSQRRGSCERVHIAQAPRKEKAQLSYLAPVKIGWLPIQRRVMMLAEACKPKQNVDHSAGQVKLKQAITPTFQKNRAPPTAPCGDVEGSHTNSGALGGRTLQTPDQGASNIKQAPGKQSLPANERSRPVGWQALRRGWNTVRESAFPGSSRSLELPAGTHSGPGEKAPLTDATGVEPLKHTAPRGSASAQPRARGPRSTGAHEAHASLHRPSGAQPMRATAPLLVSNGSPGPAQIHTSSATTTLVPRNVAGFSSITISSRKVSRSASLPSPPPPSASPPAFQRPMDPSSGHVTVQRRATIVKVTEQRVTSSPAPGPKSAGTPAAGRDPDTVVHRRKATIIKVTEHRESYRPATYRHSYSEGVYNDTDTLSRGNPSQHITAPPNPRLDNTKGPKPPGALTASTTDPEKNGGALHRSTLSLLVGSSPAPSEGPRRGVGQRSERPRRPLSCYGGVYGRTEPSGEEEEENMARPAARKWGFGLPLETGIGPVNTDRGFFSPGTAEREAARPVARANEPHRGEIESLPGPEDAERRASHCLTLIQAPDPRSHQSPEEVLALNAAAVIANIKLQRQLSKKKTPNGNSEKDSTESLLRNTVTDARAKTQPDQIRRHNAPRAAFVPLSPDPERSPGTVSLQEALERSRPDFIRRSQGRVRALERRARERRGRAGCADRGSGAAPRQRRAPRTWSTSGNDNLVKPGDRVVIGKETHLGSKRKLAEAKRKKDGEKNGEVCLSNRQRVELFKKKLLDQILQRSNN